MSFISNEIFNTAVKTVLVASSQPKPKMSIWVCISRVVLKVSDFVKLLTQQKLSMHTPYWRNQPLHIISLCNQLLRCKGRKTTKLINAQILKKISEGLRLGTIAFEHYAVAWTITQTHSHCHRKPSPQRRIVRTQIRAEIVRVRIPTLEIKMTGQTRNQRLR